MGVEWEEEIAAGTVRIRAKKALVDLTCQLVALTDALVQMDGLLLKLEAAKLEAAKLKTRTDKLVGKGFELHHGTLRIKGHRVELDLQSKEIQADNIMAFLYAGGHRSFNSSGETSGIAASGAQ